MIDKKAAPWRLAPWLRGLYNAGELLLPGLLHCGHCGRMLT